VAEVLTPETLHRAYGAAADPGDDALEALWAA
jgi:hypothetical protein